MKLSFKFFCIAYIVVLFSTGIGGSFLISNINNTLWNTRTERVDAAVNYAADSFLAFADISYGEISGSQKDDAVRQIRNSLDSVICEIDIYSQDAVSAKFTKLNENECAVTFLDRYNRLLMESVCKINANSKNYYLFVYSDFTDIRHQRDLFWGMYAIVVFCISALSGLLLFAVGKKITKPLNNLTNTADEIALGNYGKRVEIKSDDYEINILTNSVNLMSEAVAQKIKEISEELKKRDIFVADFTHEMKTPMTAIMGYAQMLRSYELEEKEKLQAAKSIYDEAKRLEKLSLQLLDLYVYQNEDVKLESVNLLEVGEQLSQTLNFLSQKYNVSFSVNFNDITVCANKVLLISLLYNLADNAFKASDSGGLIELYSKNAENGIQICVKDFGLGIKQENIKYLTEPFYREDKSRSRRLGGAGLGLSLCKKIAALHGTKLDFESEKNKGTKVSFTLLKGGNINE